MKITHVLRVINKKSLDSIKTTLKENVSDAPQYLKTVKDEKNKMITNLNNWYTRVTGTEDIGADALKKAMKATIAEAPQYINTLKEENKKIVYDKIANLNKWYVKIIGLDEVKLYQDRVTALQEQLSKTQEKRREVSKQLNEVRQRSVEIQNQIQHIDRKEKYDVYCELIKEEREIVTLERSVVGTFQEYDQTERELFTAFANAIRDSHEKQRAQLEYTKYLGLILSIAGSFLAFVYTTYKKHDLKMFIDDKLSSIVLTATSDPLVHNLIEANQNTLKEVVKTKEFLRDVMKAIVSEQVVKSLNTQGNNQLTQVHSANVPRSIELHREDVEFTINVLKFVGGVTVLAIILKAICG